MTTPAACNLILFDIDGTLLDTSGAGRRSFARALEMVFDWKGDADSISFAGATDLDILIRLAERRGCVLTPGEIASFFALLPATLQVSLATEPPRVYPGVRELLHVLSARSEVRLGLVTGNIESCARIKLEACGLHEHFVLGAFGHEHADRREIARLAVQRVTAALAPGQHVVRRSLIGDTPADITAAHAIDATAIAVATGSYSEAHLHAAGATHVVADLQDLNHLLGLLGLSPLYSGGGHGDRWSAES
jgi:phosphoglycolate phosphatase